MSGYPWWMILAPTLALIAGIGAMLGGLTVGLLWWLL